MSSLRVLTWLLVLLMIVPAGVLAWLGYRSADAYDAAVARRLRSELSEAETVVRVEGPRIVARVDQARVEALASLAEGIARRLPFDEAGAVLRAALPEDKRVHYRVVLPDTTSWGSYVRIRALRLRDAGGRRLHPAEHRPEDGTAPGWDAAGLLAELRRQADRLFHGDGEPEAARAIWRDARARLPTQALRATADVEMARYAVLAAETPPERSAIVEMVERSWPDEILRTVGRPLVRLWLAADDRDRVFRASRGGWLDEVPLTTAERDRIDAWERPDVVDALNALRTYELPLPAGARLDVDLDDLSGGGIVAKLLRRKLGREPVRVSVRQDADVRPSLPNEPSGLPAPVRIALARPGGRPLVLELHHAGISEALRARRARRLVTALGVASLLAVMLVGALLVRRALAREQAARRLRDEFIANVSHELRTPLTSVTMHAEMLAEEDPPAERRRGLARVVRAEGARLAALVDDLLDFAALERGARHLEPEPLDLARAAREAGRPYETLAERDGVELAIEIPEGEILAMGDGGALSRILANLLSNAWRHGRPSRDGAPGRLRVVVDRGASGEAFVEVRDDGPGIPARERTVIFERFRRGATAARVEGTGIGLALSRDLARAMDGDLEVLDDEETGETVFRLTLAQVPKLDV